MYAMKMPRWTQMEMRCCHTVLQMPPLEDERVVDGRACSRSMEEEEEESCFSKRSVTEADSSSKAVILEFLQQ